MNESIIKHYPKWYFINDMCLILISLITILVGMTFIYVVIRERKLRTVLNILSCNSCLCASLFSLIILWNGYYMIKIDLHGSSRQDRMCVIRNIFMLITTIKLNYSLW